MVSLHWPNLKDVAVNSRTDANRIVIDRRWRRCERNGSSAILAELEKLWKVDCQFSNTFTYVNNLTLNLRDSSVHFYHDPSDPGSLMLIGIIPAERTLILNHDENTEKYTAISRKVVGKRARYNPEKYCGWFWIHCYSKKFKRMTREAMDVYLRVLKESNKSRFDSYTVRNSVLIISHITFRDCRVVVRQPFLT